MDWIISSSILILLMFILRRMFGPKISCRLRYALWGLVMIRLLCPIGLWDGSLTLGRVVSQAETRVQSAIEDTGIWKEIQDVRTSVTRQEDPQINQELIQIPDKQAEAEPQKESERVQAETDATENTIPAVKLEEDSAEDGAWNIVPTWNLQLDNRVQEQAEETAAQADTVWQMLKRVFTTIWIVGSTIGLLWIIFVNTTFFRKLKRNRTLIETDRRYGHVRVYETEAVQSPCLFGVWKPAVYITPLNREDSDEFSMVLEHESCHYRHMDQIWVLMRGICLAVWWWNPLVWAAAKAVRRDCELACDEAVMQRIGRENRIRYGEILVKITERKSVRHPDYLVASTMASGNKDMKGRLRMIIQGTRRNMTSMIAAAVMMICCTVFCLGGESAALKQTEPLPLLAASEVYEHVLTKDGVEEFVEEAGLLSDTDIWRITPEFMKGSGVELFQDTYNKRYYVNYGTVVSELMLANYEVTDLMLLSTALADIDMDGVYELYYTASGQGTYSEDYFFGTVGMLKMEGNTSFLSFYLSDSKESDTISLLGIDEDGRLSVFKGNRDVNENDSYNFTLNRGKYIKSIEEISFSEMVPISEPDHDSFGYLRSGSNLILTQDIWQPPFGLIWGDSLDDIAATMDGTIWTETRSETETKLVWENLELFNLETDMTAFVDQGLGLIRVDFSFDPDEIEDVERALQYSLGEGEALLDKTTGPVGTRWDSIVPERLDLYNQQLYQKIEGANDITKIYRQLPMVTTALYKENNVFENGIPGTCSFQAVPAAVLMCRELKPIQQEEIEQCRKLWLENYDNVQPEVTDIYIIGQKLRKWNVDSLSTVQTKVDLETDIAGQMWEYAEGMLQSGVPAVSARTMADLRDIAEYRQLIFRLNDGTSVIILCSEDKGGMLVLADRRNEIAADMHTFRISRQEASEAYQLVQAYFELDDAQEMTEFPFGEGWIGWPDLEVVLPEAQIPLFGDLLWGDKEEEILRKLMGYTYTRREEAGTVILTFNGMMPGGRNAQVRTVISPEHGLEDVYVIWAGYDWNFLYEMKQNFGEGIAVEADGLSVDMNGLHTVASEFVLGAAREVMSVSPGEGMAAESLKEAIYWNQFMPDQLPKEIKDVYRSLHEESDEVMEQPLMNITSAYYEDETTKNELLIYRYHASAEFIQACLEYTEIQHQMKKQIADELRAHGISSENVSAHFGTLTTMLKEPENYSELWEDALDLFAYASDMDRGGLYSYGMDTGVIMPRFDTKITAIFELDDNTQFYTELFPEGICCSTGIMQDVVVRYLDLSMMGAYQPQRTSRRMMLWTEMAITDEEMASELYAKLLDIWVQSGKTSPYFTVTDQIIDISHLTFTNMTLEDTIVFIEGYGLSYEVDTESNQWVEPGRVIRIGYKKNVLKPGDTVTIYVCENETE